MKLHLKRCIRLALQSGGKYYRAASIGDPPFTLKSRNKSKSIVAPKAPGSGSVFVEIVGDDIYKSYLWLKGLPECPTVLDVGSNFGLFSCWLKLHVPNAKVTAVEPHPNFFPFLRENAKTFNFDVLPYAITHEKGRASIDLTCDSTTASVFQANGINIPQDSDFSSVDGIEWQIFLNTSLLQLIC